MNTSTIGGSPVGGTSQPKDARGIINKSENSDNSENINNSLFVNADVNTINPEVRYGRKEEVVSPSVTENSVDIISKRIVEINHIISEKISQPNSQLTAREALVGQQITWNDHKEIKDPIDLIKEVYSSGFGIKYLTRSLNKLSETLVASIEDSRDNFHKTNTIKAKTKDVILIIGKSFLLFVVVLLTIATATIHSLFGSNNGNDVIDKKYYPRLHKIITTGVLLLKIGMYVTLGVSSAGFLTFLLNPALIFSYAGGYGPLVVSIFDAIMASSLTFSQLTLIWVAVSIYACFRVAREVFVYLATQKSNNLAEDALNKQISEIKAQLIDSISLNVVIVKNFSFLSDDDKNIAVTHFDPIKTQIDKDVTEFLKEVKNLDATANNKQDVSNTLAQYRNKQLECITELKNTFVAASNQHWLLVQDSQQEYAKAMSDLISELQLVQDKLKSAIMESNEQQNLQSEIEQKIEELTQHREEILGIKVDNYNECMHIKTKIESEAQSKAIVDSVCNLLLKVDSTITTNNSNVDEEVKKLKSKFDAFIKESKEKTDLLTAKSRVIFEADNEIFVGIKNFIDELEQKSTEITGFKIEQYQHLEQLRVLTDSFIKTELEPKLQKLENLLEQKIIAIVGDIVQYSAEKVTLIEAEINELSADVKSNLREDVVEYEDFISKQQEKIRGLPSATPQDLKNSLSAIDVFKKSCDTKYQNLMVKISNNQALYIAFTKYDEDVKAHNKMIDDIINTHNSLKDHDTHNILPKIAFNPKQHKIEYSVDFKSYYATSQSEDNKTACNDNFYDLKLTEKQNSLLKLCSSWNDRFKEQVTSKKRPALASKIPTTLFSVGYSNKNDMIDNDKEDMIYNERKRGESYYEQVVFIEFQHREDSEDLVTKLKTPSSTNEIMQSMRSIDGVLTCYSRITNYEAQLPVWIENYKNHKLIERSLIDYKKLFQDDKALKLSVDWTKAEIKTFATATKAITDIFDTNHRDYTKKMQEKDPKRIKEMQLLFITQLQQSVQDLKVLYSQQLKFESKNSINYKNLRNHGWNFINNYNNKLQKIQDTKIGESGIGEEFIRNHEEMAQKYRQECEKYSKYLQELKTGTAKQYPKAQQYSKETEESIKGLYQDLNTKFDTFKNYCEKTEVMKQHIAQFNIAIEETKLVNVQCLPEGEAKNELEKLQGDYKVAIDNIKLDMNKSQYNKQCAETLTDYKATLHYLYVRYKVRSKNSLLESVNTINTSLASNMVDVRRLSPTDQEYKNHLQQLQNTYSEIRTKINNINDSTNVDDINTVYEEVQTLEKQLKDCNNKITAAHNNMVQKAKEYVQSADKLIHGLFKTEGNESNGIIYIQGEYAFIKDPKKLYQLLKQHHEKLNLLLQEDLDDQSLQSITKDVENIKKITSLLTNSFQNAKVVSDWISNEKDIDIIAFVGSLYKEYTDATNLYCNTIVERSNIDYQQQATTQKLHDAMSRLIHVKTIYQVLSVELGVGAQNAPNDLIQNMLSTINRILIVPRLHLSKDSKRIIGGLTHVCNGVKFNFTPGVEQYINRCRDYSAYENQGKLSKFFSTKVPQPPTPEAFVDALVDELFVEKLNYQSFISCAHLIVELEGKRLAVGTQEVGKQKVGTQEVGTQEGEYYKQLLKSAYAKLEYLADDIINDKLPQPA